MSISDKTEAFANEVHAALQAAGIRSTLNVDSEKIGAKIRLAQLDKVPYMLVVGQKEAEVRQVSVRHSKRGDLGAKGLEEFVSEVSAEIAGRNL